MATPGSRAGRDAHLRPGGTLRVAMMLRAWGLHVGLVATLDDDIHARRFQTTMMANGIDVSAVTLVPRATSVNLVDMADAFEAVAASRAEDQPIAIPELWSSQVLVLSGLSPVVPYAASLCQAARAARRAGTIVVLDVNARRHAWAGHDPRRTRMVVQEADIVRCSNDDLVAIGTDRDLIER